MEHDIKGREGKVRMIMALTCSKSQGKVLNIKHLRPIEEGLKITLS